MKFKKGHIPWNKGLKTGLVPKSAFKKGHPAPKTAYKKGHIPHFKGKKRPDILKEKHPQWKGKNAKYSAFHMRIRSYRGIANQCKVCKRNDENGNYQWANLTGEYWNLNDYKQMCASCHRKYDLKRTTNSLLSNHHLS